MKLKKLDNNGKPFLVEGREVIEEFDDAHARRILSHGTRWEKIGPEDVPKERGVPFGAEAGVKINQQPIENDLKNIKNP